MREREKKKREKRKKEGVFVRTDMPMIKYARRVHFVIF